MRVFWERTGVLYPVYRLVGQGLSDGEIANKLNVTELKVQSCIAWMLHFLKFTDRKELAQYASPALAGRYGLGLNSTGTLAQLTRRNIGEYGGSAPAALDNARKAAI